MDSVPSSIYDLFMKLGSGRQQDVLLSRLERHLRYSGFQVELDSPDDLKALPDAAAEKALELIHELMPPTPSASDVAHLL